MKAFRTGFLMNLSRSLILIAATAAGALVSQSASARIGGVTASSDRLVVPAFVKDVRALIVDAAQARGWRLVGESPGELTFELQHVRSHMDVVVRSFYSNSEISFRRVSAKTFQCDPQAPCEVNQDVVQRWMLGLRRDVGVALLRLAIKDAGGTLPADRAAVAETE